MKIKIIGVADKQIQVTLSEDEFEMLRQAIKELPEAVDENDCHARTGYELKDLIAIKDTLFDFKLPRE